jgi:hypothetical protein
MVRRLGASHSLTPLAAAWPRWADRAGVEMQGIGPVREIAGIENQVVLMGFREAVH